MTDNSRTHAITRIDGDALMAKLAELAAFSEDEGQLTRTLLTDTHRAAAKRIADWMRNAGLTTHIDAIGNVVGRYEGSGRSNGQDTPASGAPAISGPPTIVVGSHFDTVRNGGWYDGSYGVLAGIACVQTLHEAGKQLPCAIEVIGFSDEEGVRFGATLLGSRAVAGTFDAALLSRQDADGVSLEDTIRQAGHDTSELAAIARPAGSVAAFLEIHIEQGPVLLEEDLAVGVVTAIAGASRFEVTVTGLAGHAGTLPMHMRRDAGLAAAEAMLAIEQVVRAEPGTVGTCGQLEIVNGAANVVPGLARFSVDLRSGDDAQRRRAVAAMLDRFTEIAARRSVTIDAAPTHDAPAATCDPGLQAHFAGAIERAGIAPRYLLSGAGHDAMAMADIAPIAMLFVRCGNGGISHHPDETMTAQDAGIGANVLLDTIIRIAEANK